MTYYRDFFICCCRVVLCQIVHKCIITDNIFFDDNFDDKQPISHQIGVIRAVYVSGGILGVNASYSVKQLCLLLNKRLPFLKIPIDKQIPIVFEHL